MHAKIPLALALLAGLAAAGPSAAQEEEPEEADAVRAAVSSFHDALAGGDSTGALALLVPDVIVYEGGHAETREQYRAGHLAADMEFASAVEFTPISEDVTVFDEAALYLREYDVRGTWKGEEIEARGTETMVLVPDDDGWRIRHIHWSSR